MSEAKVQQAVAELRQAFGVPADGTQGYERTFLAAKGYEPMVIEHAIRRRNVERQPEVADLGSEVSSEISALAVVANALVSLDGPARQRVLRWIAQRFDVRGL